ncbi:MAG: WYL domain-containing protein [Bacilli bacterium]|nr:WYL domain-containing protein [Bacilli bacterium]
MTGKKASIILVLRTLEQYSDQENPLTQQAIINRINQNYGIQLERKSVAASLAVLRDELDYDINKSPKGGFYLGERLFEPSEVNYLTDAIFSSKAISGNYAKDLSKKVMSVLSDNYQKNYRPVYKCDQIDRSEDKGFFLTIDAITHALRHNRKVAFKYMTYDENLHMVPRLKNGQDTVIVSPLYMVYSRGLCYLLSIPEHKKDEQLKDFTSYRIDYIRDIREVKDSVREKATSLSKYKNGFDIAEFINNHIYIFGSDEKTVIKLLVKKPDSIRYLKEWFGKQVSLKKDGSKIIASIKSDEQTFFFWIMQYSEHFTLLEPQSLIKKVRAAAKNILDTYK